MSATVKGISSLHSLALRRSEKLFTQYITFFTLQNEEFTFQCANSEDIKDVVLFFLEGLKKRSKYAVATDNYKPAGN